MIEHVLPHALARGGDVGVLRAKVVDRAMILRVLAATPADEHVVVVCQQKLLRGDTISRPTVTSPER